MSTIGAACRLVDEGGKRTSARYNAQMTDIQTTTPPFDWEEVEQATISAVMARGATRLNDGTLSCDQIALVLEGRAVVLGVSADTDEVIVSLESWTGDVGSDWRPLDQLKEVVSRTLGWCWLARNYRGYVDTFTVAFDGIDPQFSFVGCGSSLWCNRLSPIAA